MPSVSYGSGAYRRQRGSFPELKLVNMFVEQAPTSENQVALLSRRGLSEVSTVGNGPIEGVFSQAGTFNGDLFTVSNGSLYRGSTLLGSIDGTGPVSWAASAIEVVVTRGETAYSYNGTNLAAIAFPDSADVRAVEFLGGFFLYLRSGTQKFYWSDVLDGRTIDPLSFASAEREPDELLDIRVLGDNLLLFGQSTTEMFALTGDLDAPFQRFEQVVFEKGVRATGCVARADNTVLFIGDQGVVYRHTGEAPQRVSDHGVEERIEASSDASMFSYVDDGHEFACIRLDDTTLAIDLATQGWCEFQSEGGNFHASCAAMIGDDVRFGHSETNQIMTLDGWDELGAAHERRFTAAVPLDVPLSINRVHLWADTGATTDLSGQGANPVVELRMSDDGGRTYDDWESDPLGPSGAYRTVPEWRARGMFDFPGALMEFRVTDPVPFRVSGVKVNDPAGGRSR